MRLCVLLIINVLFIEQGLSCRCKPVDNQKDYCNDTDLPVVAIVITKEKKTKKRFSKRCSPAIPEPPANLQLKPVNNMNSEADNLALPDEYYASTSMPHPCGGGGRRKNKSVTMYAKIRHIYRQGSNVSVSVGMKIALMSPKWTSCGIDLKNLKGRRKYIIKLPNDSESLSQDIFVSACDFFVGANDKIMVFFRRSKRQRKISFHKYFKKLNCRKKNWNNS